MSTRLKIKLRNPDFAAIRLGAYNSQLKILTLRDAETQAAVFIADGPHPGFRICVSDKFSSIAEAAKAAEQGFYCHTATTYGFDEKSIEDALRSCPNVEVIET